MLTIKANTYYRTRNGKKAYVATIIPANPFTNNQVECPVLGYIRDTLCSWGINGHQDDSFDDDLDLVAEWVDETPVSASAGLSLLEAMRSGRDFRPVGSDTELDYLRIDRNGYVVFINGAGTTPMDDKRLTARYELRPEEPAKLLECWVVYDQKGNFVSQYYEHYIAASSVMAAFPGYTIKHMREVVGG